MNTIRLGIFLIAAIAAGCSSNPHQESLPATESTAVEPTPEQTDESFVALPETQTEPADGGAEQTGEDPVAQTTEAVAAYTEQNPRQQYKSLSALPEAESRALQFYLGTQTFHYSENGEVLVTGPIASGKASSPTPTGKFRVLSKDEDKESSRYDNEVGTPAWMPFSMQFHGNYFLHEGYLPGEPASHGCIRLSHYDARLLFDRMKVGDPVVVSK